MTFTKYDILRSYLYDIQEYSNQVIDYLENKELYDSCECFDFKEFLVYYKSSMESMDDLIKLSYELEEEKTIRD